MNIKIDKADKIFSQYIRIRDKECLRCGSSVLFDAKGIPKSHQCSHYWGRGRESTRFEPDNCITLCFYCHRKWGHGDERDEYKEFMIKRLGQKRFDTLAVQANTYCKKDREMAYLTIKKTIRNEEL